VTAPSRSCSLIVGDIAAAKSDGRNHQYGEAQQQAANRSPQHPDVQNGARPGIVLLKPEPGAGNRADRLFIAFVKTRQVCVSPLAAQVLEALHIP